MISILTAKPTSLGTLPYAFSNTCFGVIAFLSCWRKNEVLIPNPFRSPTGFESVLSPAQVIFHIKTYQSPLLHVGSTRSLVRPIPPLLRFNMAAWERFELSCPLSRTITFPRCAIRPLWHHAMWGLSVVLEPAVAPSSLAWSKRSRLCF